MKLLTLYNQLNNYFTYSKFPREAILSFAKDNGVEINKPILIYKKKDSANMSIKFDNQVPLEWFEWNIDKEKSENIPGIIDSITFNNETHQINLIFKNNFDNSNKWNIKNSKNNWNFRLKDKVIKIVSITLSQNNNVYNTLTFTFPDGTFPAETQNNNSKKVDLTTFKESQTAFISYEKILINNKNEIQEPYDIYKYSDNIIINNNYEINIRDNIITNIVSFDKTITNSIIVINKNKFETKDITTTNDSTNLYFYVENFYEELHNNIIKKQLITEDSEEYNKIPGGKTYLFNQNDCEIYTKKNNEAEADGISIYELLRYIKTYQLNYNFETGKSQIGKNLKDIIEQIKLFGTDFIIRIKTDTINDEYGTSFGDIFIDNTYKGIGTKIDWPKKLYFSTTNYNEEIRITPTNISLKPGSLNMRSTSINVEYSYEDSEENNVIDEKIKIKKKIGKLYNYINYHKRYNNLIESMKNEILKREVNFSNYNFNCIPHLETTGWLRPTKIYKNVTLPNGNKEDNREWGAKEYTYKGRGTLTEADQTYIKAMSYLYV